MDGTPSYNLAVLRFPGGNAEHPGSSGWVMAMGPVWAADPRIRRVIPLRRSDTPIPMVRNLLVRHALRLGADYILMLDADVIPDAEPDGVPFWDEAWGFLMERRAREDAHAANRLAGDGDDDEARARVAAECGRLYPPATIAAPYCGPPPDECVYVARWYGSETNSPDWPRPFRLALYDRDHASRFAGVQPAAALPTGLILYDARVFRDLPPPWFYYEWADEYQDRKASTEDFVQTRNASILGLPQYCAWSSWAGHWKAKLVRRPRPLEPDAVPEAFAAAVRKGMDPGSRVVYLRSEEDPPGRPALVAGPPGGRSTG